MLCVSYLAFLFLSITPGLHVVKVSLDCRPWQWLIYILDNVPSWFSLPRKEFSTPLQLSSMVSGFKSFDVDELVSAFLHFKNLPDCWLYLIGLFWFFILLDLHQHFFGPYIESSSKRLPRRRWTTLGTNSCHELNLSWLTEGTGLTAMRLLVTQLSSNFWTCENDGLCIKIAAIHKQL